MFQGLSVGRLFGVEIKLNISLIIIALLVTAITAGSVLPSAAPDYAIIVYIVAGMLTAVLFISSVLWHELAHAIVAQRYRIPVVQIVLYVFGGVAQIARDPERPGQEFWIAIAGPLSSLLLAAIFGTIGALVSGIGAAAASYLATVNLSLAVFNLLPGFPLDGGRVLRAILWKIWGSYKRASRGASRVGQGVAILFAIGAIGLILAGGGLFSGIWLLLIAAFLYSMATATLRMAGGASLPMGTPIRSVMRFNVPTIAPDTPLAILAWRYMDHAPDQAFPVMEGDYLVGIVSAAEVASIPRLEWGTVRAAKVMLRRDKVCFVAPDDDLAAAMTRLDALRQDHAPVFQDGRFLGMLNRRDIVYRT